MIISKLPHPQLSIGVLVLNCGEKARIGGGKPTPGANT